MVCKDKKLHYGQQSPSMKASDKDCQTPFNKIYKYLKEKKVQKCVSTKIQNGPYKFGK
jgi:hypothetical protein